jgi:hypothetical protein
MDRKIRRRHAFAALRALAAVVPGMVFAAGAEAAVVISSDATQDMTCSAGVCAPTAKKAVLNVGDLETMLGSGSVTITTTGSDVQASDVQVKSALGWIGDNALSLVAKRSVEIDQAMTVEDQGGLAIETGAKGLFSFGKKGSVTFSDLASQLTINGGTYVLVGNIKTLASDIASNPAANFALANDFDASGDGTYFGPPIRTLLTGAFEGLGHKIFNLSIADGAAELDSSLYDGLFAGLGAEGSLNGTIENVGLITANVAGPKKYTHVYIGSLVGRNWGTIRSSYSTGEVKNAAKSYAGGLVGINYGTVANSHSDSKVLGGHFLAGGLVASNEGTISDSYSTGNITVRGAVGMRAMPAAWSPSTMR